MDELIKSRQCQTVGELRDWLEDIPDTMEIDSDSQFPVVFNQGTDYPALSFESDSDAEDESDFILIGDDGEIDEDED